MSKFPKPHIVLVMDQGEWRERLRAACKASRKSMRRISREAGLGDSFLSGVLKEGKDPSLSNIIKICDVLGLTLSKLAYGYDIDKETESVLRLWAQLDPERQKALLALLQGAGPPQEK